MDALTLKPCVITHEGGPYERYMDKQQAHTHTQAASLVSCDHWQTDSCAI